MVGGFYEPLIAVYHREEFLEAMERIVDEGRSKPIDAYPFMDIAFVPEAEIVENGISLDYVSPLPPVRTGIADYSTDLLPHLDPPPANLTVWLSEDIDNGGEVESVQTRYPWAQRAVLVERVEGFAPEDEWRKGYRDIVDFERTIADDGCVVIKFWLHISKDEQARRFEKLEKDRPLRRRTGTPSRAPYRLRPR